MSTVCDMFHTVEIKTSPAASNLHSAGTSAASMTSALPSRKARNPMTQEEKEELKKRVPNSRHVCAGCALLTADLVVVLVFL